MAVHSISTKPPIQRPALEGTNLDLVLLCDEINGTHGELSTKSWIHWTFVLSTDLRSLWYMNTCQPLQLEPLISIPRHIARYFSVAVLHL